MAFLNVVADVLKGITDNILFMPFVLLIPIPFVIFIATPRCLLF